MSLSLFKSLYTVRKYGEQTIVKGYASSSYSDISARLNVQPLSPDELAALPEGERTVKRIKAFGSEKFTSADEFSETPADRLFYSGKWYECKSSVMWNHTLLSHYRSEFVILPAGEQAEAPTGAIKP
ncbi:MAG: hypothetical protein LBS21_01530 [Clostridiales bacterium]|jgi:hypothetical protein|nr:hypothetical protein [Clostridiales bacterium]